MIVLCLIGYFDVEAGINILLIFDCILALLYAWVGVMAAGASAAAAAATVADVAAAASFFELTKIP